MTLKIYINGEEKEFGSESTIFDIVSTMDVNPRKIAVEKNKEIIPKSTYKNETISSGDVIEIVDFVGGG